MIELSFILFNLGVCLVLCFLYKWIKRNNEYFTHRGIAAIKPIVFFGNTREFVFNKVGLIEFIKKLYNDFPNEK